VVIALVVAFLLSSFVYKQFQKASIVKPTSTQSLVVAAVPLPLARLAFRRTIQDVTSTNLRANPLRGWRSHRQAAMDAR
jgi:hypothetical protein